MVFSFIQEITERVDAHFKNGNGCNLTYDNHNVSYAEECEVVVCQRKVEKPVAVKES